MGICTDHGLEFIGPKPDHIRVMGDKATARATMQVRAGFRRPLGAHSRTCLSCGKASHACILSGALRCAHIYVLILFSQILHARTMQKAGVPTVPGSKGLIKDEADALQVVKEIGIPVMIKATAGARA